MSNIDNYQASNNGSFSYQKTANYTERVKHFLEEFDAIIPDVVKEFDDLEKRSEAKKCKAFAEKMKGLSTLKRFHDNPIFKDMFYWYIKEPNQKAQ